MLYHEYMHVTMMGHTKPIPDFQELLPSTGHEKVTVYGASRASELAHLNYPKNAVNTNVRLNADNYAYLAINYLVRKSWGAKRDPFNFLDKNPPLLPTFRRRDIAARQKSGSDEKWPRNCLWNDDPTKVKCTPIRMDYSEYVADLGVLR